MSSKFNFALYFTLNQDRIVKDFYEFHPSSWVFVLVLKLIECISIAGALSEDTYSWCVEPIWSLLNVSLSPLVMWCFMQVLRGQQLEAIANNQFPTEVGG